MSRAPERAGDPRGLRPDLDERSRFYEGFAGEWDDAMDREELGKRLRLVFGRLLTQVDLRGRLVLDAGAGTGHFSRALSERGARLVSLDLGHTLLRETRRKAETLPVQGSLLDLPFANGLFDVVLCTEAIEHTSDPRRAVSELCRVTARGGVLALTVPNRLWKPAVIAANALGRPYRGYENWVGYGELASWVREGGLEIELQRGFNLMPHTFFCRPAFDALDGIPALHPFMINMAIRARKAR